MAFLQRRGLPEEIILDILQRAGAECVATICSLSREDCEYVREVLEPDFEGRWSHVIDGLALVGYAGDCGGMTCSHSRARLLILLSHRARW